MPRAEPLVIRAEPVSNWTDDELAAAGMVLGAGWAGARAFTSTAGPGISLMSEFVGLGYYAEIPGVFVDVQRTGPSTGMPTRTQQGDLLSIATETERTLFFDFLPLDLGTVHGFRTRFHLYTVPGQILYERTRMAVLNGADGIVFVVDSQSEKFEENIQSISELEMNMRRLDKDVANFPLIMQWNKRDLPDILPVEDEE